MEKIILSQKDFLRPQSGVGNPGAGGSPGKTKRQIFMYFIVFLFIAVARLNAAITGNTIVCANSSELYTHSFTSGYTYIWNVTGAAQSASNSNSLAVTWGPGGAGVVTLVIKDNFGVVVETSSLNVFVNTLPEPEIIPENANGCSYLTMREHDSVYQITDSSDVCYIVCDSTVFGYSPGIVVAQASGYTYQWAVIPATAMVSFTNGAWGLVQIEWGAPSNSPVTLRLYATDPATGCTDSVDACIRIIARPRALFSTFPAAVSNTVHICYNSTVAFFDQSTDDPNSTIASWYWDFGDGTTSTLQYPTHTFTNDSTYEVKLIVENQCHCKDSMMLTVIVEALPGPDITCISAVCFNSSDTYCTSYACSPFTWSVTNGTITSGAGTSCIDVDWGTNGPGSISLQGSTCGSSCAYPTQVLVPILTPTTTITGPNPACAASGNFYNVPNVPSTSYSWTVSGPGSGPSGTIIAGQGTNGISVFWDTIPGVCTINLVYTNQFLGCSGSASYTVLIAPRHIISGSAVICQNTTENYMSNSANADWTITDAGGNTVYSGSGASASYLFNTPGAYVIYAADQTGTLCGTPAAFQVQVVAQPPVVTASINTVICPGQTYLYTGVPTSNNYYLKWSITGGTPSGVTGNAISVTWNSMGPWLITLTQVGVLPPSCESQPTTYTMSNPPPPAPPILGNSTTCYNKTEVYSTTSVAETYSWSLAPGSLASILPGTAPDNISVQLNNGSTTNVVVLTLQITSCGASTLSTLSITVNPPPPAVIVAPSVICEGQPANFSTTTPGGPYAWDFGDGSSPGSGSSVNHTYNSVLPYVVSLTVTSPGGCIGTAVTSTIINVNPTPVANITSPNQLNGACVSSFSYSLYASAQTIAGTPSYTWLPVASSVNSVITTVTGVHSMTVGINGCYAQTSVMIDTSCAPPGPGCTFAFPGTNTAVASYNFNCTDVQFSPNITGTGGFVSSWFFGDPFNSSSTSNNPSFTYTSSGYYHVRLICGWPAAAGGFCYQEDTLLVALPIFSDFKYNFSCGSPGFVTDFIDQSNNLPPTPISTWAWDINSGAYTSSSQNPSFNLPAGSYTAQLTITYGLVSCMTTKTLVVPQKPAAGFIAPTDVCEGNPITFTNTSAPTSGITEYAWDFGDATGLITYNPNPNGVRTYTSQSSPYSVNLTITDDYGCTDTFGPLPVTVHVNSFNATNISVTPATSVICQGDSVYICFGSGTSAPNPNTPYTYLWSNFETGSCIYAKQPGLYKVVATDTFGCHSDQLVSSLNVILVPTPLIAGNLSYCDGEIPFMSIDRGAGYDYQWLYGDAASPSTTGPCTSPLFPPPCSVIAPGTFTPGTFMLQGFITETSSGLGCTALGPPITVAIHTLPAAPTVVTSTCVQSFPVTLTASGPAGYNILWNTGAQGATVSAATAGVYWAFIVDFNGCKSPISTATVFPLPDFNPLIFGCYEICDNDTTTITAPPGYLTYSWIKNNSVIIGPVNTPTNLVFTNPSTIPGGNAGVYYLALETTHFCLDTSKAISITTIPCATCDIHMGVDSFYCVPSDDSTLPGDGYHFQFTVYNGGGSNNIFTVTPATGTLVINTPATLTLSPGINTVTGIFYAGTGDEELCLNFSLGDEDGVLECSWDTCFLLPPCHPVPCNLHDVSLEVRCQGVDSNGNPIYDYGLNYSYGATGTVVVSSPQGMITPVSGIATPGGNNITGSFTDTPMYDGTFCIDLYIYNEDDGWCHEQVCVPLPGEDPCSPHLERCNDLEAQVEAMSCYTINADGNRVYNLSLVMSSPSSSTYSFYIISGQGYFGPSSPTLINSPAVFTQTFVQTSAFVMGGQLCFTVIATNTVTGEMCEFRICIRPELCDDADGRLMNTASVNLYPNPTEDYTIAEYVIDDKTAYNKLSVIDLNGRTVLEQPLKETRGTVRLNTSSLIPGMYFLKAMNNDKVILVKKLIIQR